MFMTHVFNDFPVLQPREDTGSSCHIVAAYWPCLLVVDNGGESDKLNEQQREKTDGRNEVIIKYYRPLLSVTSPVPSY
jgi:hypothetical protein